MSGEPAARAPSPPPVMYARQPAWDAPPVSYTHMGNTLPVPENLRESGGATRRRLPQRVGMWTREEEAYAAAVGKLFVAGRVPNCPEGTTLRALLADLLNCAPMRPAGVLRPRLRGALLVPGPRRARPTRDDALSLRAFVTGRRDATWPWATCPNGPSAPRGPRSAPPCPSSPFLCVPHFHGAPMMKALSPR